MLINNAKKNSEKEKWYLEGSSGSGKRYIIPIDKNPFIIGRSKECHLILSAKGISRKHAKIVFKGEYLYLSDLKSTNGTFKNTTRITDEVLLNDGDILHFGDIKFNVVTSGNKEDSFINTLHQEEPGTKENDFAEYYNISQREREILFLLLEGKSTKEIADKLCIADGTAKNHVIKIFKKTNSHSRVSLVNKFNEFITKQ